MPAPTLSKVQAIANRLVTVILATTAALGAAELYWRLAEPQPPRQVIRPSPEVQIEDIAGVAVWSNPTITPTLRNEDCVQEDSGRVVVIVGDSILAGWGVPLAERWSVRLQEPLAQQGICLMNYASPGFGVPEESALMTRALERFSPAVVLYEVYSSAAGDGGRNRALLGDTIYGLEGLPRATDGFPSVFGLPTALNRLLFLHSRVYEYATLSLSGPIMPEANEMAHTLRALEAAATQARAHGAQLYFVLAHHLDTPQGAFKAQPEPAHAPALAVAREHDDVHIIDLSDAVEGVPLRSIRLDSCCHFNTNGQTLLAQDLQPRIVQAVAASLNPPTAGSL